MSVKDDDLNRIWDEDRIAIHFPGDAEHDSRSLEPGDYAKPSDRQAIRCFSSLAANGGYVWAEHRSQSNIKIGKVLPQEPRLVSATWTKTADPRYTNRAGEEAVLKTVQMESVKLVKPGEAMSLRAARRRQGTISRWWACQNRLASLVEGRPVEPSWDNLPPDLQETACAEFLRLHDNPTYPRLSFLLMPVGRTLKDVDIYGLDQDGSEIYAQVTFFKRESAQSKEKIAALKGYEGPTNKLVYFCRQDSTDSSVSGDTISYISTEEVLKWLESTDLYKDKLFSI